MKLICDSERIIFNSNSYKVKGCNSNHNRSLVVGQIKPQSNHVNDKLGKKASTFRTCY